MSDKAVRMLCRTLLVCTCAVLIKQGTFEDWWATIANEESAE